jgi:hypothetical protein
LVKVVSGPQYGSDHPDGLAVLGPDLFVSDGGSAVPGFSGTTCFGLPGELGHSLLPYVKDGNLLGFNRQGEHPGWTFSNDEDWKRAEVFQWVGQAIGSADATEAQRRGLIALQSLSKAIVDQRSTMRMVQVVMALEALLSTTRGPDRPSGWLVTSLISGAGVSKVISAADRGRRAHIWDLTRPVMPAERSSAS